MRTIYQLPRNRLRDNYSGRNGSQTAANANANRQYNRSWRGQRQHCKQKVEVNGHENQLAALQRGTETIVALLESGTYKPWRLLDEAPCIHTPPHSMANILNTKKVPPLTPTKTPSYGSGNSINNNKTKLFWTHQAEPLQQGCVKHSSKYYRFISTADPSTDHDSPI